MLSPLVENLLDLALLEDLAYGDITTDNLFSPHQTAKAHMACRQSAVISGLAAARRVFEKVDPLVQCSLVVEDGAAVSQNSVLMLVEGPTQSLLRGERLALNLVQHLSGIATLTYQFVGAVGEAKTKIVHTRKTIPGLRALEIEAVLHGGGSPHRKSLSHAVLLKDNHIQAAGSIQKAVEKLRKATGHTTRIEVECDTLNQVDEALNAGVDALLLDNMDVKTMHEAVKRAEGKALTEASGGVKLSTVHEIAKTGVDYISTSQITLSAPAVDIGLDFSDTL